MPTITAIPSSIPAFIGYTEKRMHRDGTVIPEGSIVPVKISSLAEYQNYFGKAINETFIEITITEAIQGDNSISLSANASLNHPSQHNLYYALKLFFDNGGGECYIVSVGTTHGSVEKTDLLAGLKALEAIEEPDLLVIPEGKALPEADYYVLVSAAIDHAASHGNRFLIFDVHSTKSNVTDTINHFRTAFTQTDHLQYAAVYYPALVCIYHIAYDPKDVTLSIQSAAPQTCQMDSFENNHPYYIVATNAIKNLQRIQPASAAMAGAYAYIDYSRGIWKAPANVSINGVIATEVKINQHEQDEMNVDAAGGKSINAIREFAGRGILAWGARTLKGNDNEWKYISVRRYYMFINRSVYKGTQWVVFEPNDANTWIRVKGDIENFLTLQWRNGALQGPTSNHAYYVHVGLGTTMTANDILEGRLIIEYGMAMVRPSEFIITRIEHILST